MTKEGLDNWVLESDPLYCCARWLAQSRRSWWRMSCGLSLPHVLMVGCKVMLLVPGGLPQAVSFTTLFPRGAYRAVSPHENISGNICLQDSSLCIRVYCLLTQALTTLAGLWIASGNWPFQNKTLRKKKKLKKFTSLTLKLYIFSPQRVCHLLCSVPSHCC